MLITFPCPACQSALEVDAAAVGEQVACPGCHAPVTIPRMSIGPGFTIGGFRVEKPLAVGGMGQVFLARQISMGRRVALKILPSQMTLERENVERFLNEVRILAGLNHPHIVTAFEAGEDSGVLFLAMAYVEGGSLEDRVQHGGPLPEKDALTIVRKVASALDYAWAEHRLLHRDVKPANILLDAQGEPKLVDLGLAKTGQSDPGLTMAGLMVGTPNYMSPEQISGDAELDGRSDMHALGLTLYYMLTGRVPFDSPGVMEVLRKHSSEPLPDPRSINPAISDPCVELMEVMLAKSRQARHADWAALISDVKRVLAGHSPARRPPAVSAFRRRSASKVLSRGPAREAVPRPVLDRLRAEAEPRSVPAGLIVTAIAALIAVLSLAAWLHAHRQPAAEVAAPAQIPPSDRKPAAASSEGAPDALARASQQAADELRASVGRLIAAGDVAQADTLLADAARSPLAAHLRAAAAELAPRVAEARAQAERQAARTRDAAAMAAAEARPRLLALTDEIAACLLQLDLAAATNRLEAARNDPILRCASAELGVLASDVQAVVRYPATVLDSFAREIGQEIAVEMRMGGAETVSVVSVASGRVTVRRRIPGGHADQSIGVAQLTAREQLNRIGADPGPARSIMRGWAALGARDAEMAEREFASAATPLGAALAGQIARARTQRSEEKAREAWAGLLKLAEVPADLSSTADVTRAVGARSYSSNQAARLRAAVELYRKQHGDTETARAHEAVMRALAGASAARPSPQPARAETRKVTTETMEAVMRDLVARNGKFQPVAYTVHGDSVSLDFDGRRIRDITPLAGLPIRRLVLNHNPVTDLQPLAGLPIQELHIRNTPVRDLTPLKGMPLRVLGLGPGEYDLTPLAGMPLDQVVFTDVVTESFKPLRSCPIRLLDFDGRNPDWWKKLGDYENLPEYLPNVTALTLRALGLDSAPPALLRLPRLNRVNGIDGSLTGQALQERMDKAMAQKVESRTSGHRGVQRK